MSDKPSAAEQASEIARRIYEDELSMGGAEEAIDAAITAATERTARRCVEICRDHYGQFGEVSAQAIAKEFGLD